MRLPLIVFELSFHLSEKAFAVNNEKVNNRSNEEKDSRDSLT